MRKERRANMTARLCFADGSSCPCQVRMCQGEIFIRRQPRRGHGRKSIANSEREILFRTVHRIVYYQQHRDPLLLLSFVCVCNPAADWDHLSHPHPVLTDNESGRRGRNSASQMSDAPKSVRPSTINGQRNSKP